jgi:hypothetical protein
MFREEQTKLNLELSLANHICLITDMWTGKANVAFTGLTAHYIDSMGIFKSSLMDCARFEGCHTAENIQSELQV